MSAGVRICTASSSATAGSDCRGQVLISGSYGGEYNAYHAARWGVRAVVLNDAGVGHNRAGIRGLDYLDRLGIAAAAADARSCHIGDGEHMLQHGRISFVNAAATRIGCRPGQSVRECAAAGDKRRQALPGSRSARGPAGRVPGCGAAAASR
jgi:hypothetical protein